MLPSSCINVSCAIIIVRFNTESTLKSINNIRSEFFGNVIFMRDFLNLVLVEKAIAYGKEGPKLKVS